MDEYRSLILYLRQRYSEREIDEELKADFENDIKDILPYRNVEIYYDNDELTSTVVSQDFSISIEFQNDLTRVRVINSNITNYITTNNEDSITAYFNGTELGTLRIEDFQINTNTDIETYTFNARDINTGFIANSDSISTQDLELRVEELERINNVRSNDFTRQYTAQFLGKAKEQDTNKKKIKTLNKININNYVI